MQMLSYRTTGKRAGAVLIVDGSAHIHQAVAFGAPGAALPANKYGVAAFAESAEAGELLQAADLVSRQ